MKPSKTIIAEKQWKCHAHWQINFQMAQNWMKLRGRVFFCIKYIYINEMRGQEEIF